MCGIAGVITADRFTGEQAVGRMNKLQRHRGPDDEGLEAVSLPHGHLILGQRRLAILDLSRAGHQPMSNPDTGDSIVFNGEIYNFLELRRELEATGTRFRSRCDTEVILHAYAHWGTGCFARLHGMFALALYDARARQLVLARDHLGIKPLYLAHGQGALAFASEVRPLVHSGLIQRDLDPRGLAGLLAYGGVPGPLTLLRDVRLLQPGTWERYDLAQEEPWRASASVQRFWDFPQPNQWSVVSGQWSAKNQGSVASGQWPVEECRQPLSSLTTDHWPLTTISAEMHSRLAEAVRSHLVSDVPVGLFLSSGIDSNALAALAGGRSGERLAAFNVALEDHPDMNEGNIAASVAGDLGVPFHRVTLTHAEVQKQVQEFLGCVDQPTVDGLNTFIISRAVRERGIVVALSGLGGDEVFGGYSTFRDIPRLARWHRLTAWVPAKIRRGIAGWVYRNEPAARHSKAMEMASKPASLRSFYLRRRRVLSDLEMNALGLSPEPLGLDDDFLAPECDPARGLPRSDPVAAIGILESRFYMGNILLRDADVFGMAHGLEIRVPLLDRRVVDLGYSLPGSLRVRGKGPNKPVLVEALGNKLRPDLAKLSKRGFSLPLASWMAGPLHDLFEHLVQLPARHGIVDSSGASSIWESFLRDRTGPTWSRAWLLGVLGSWLQRL